MRGFCFGFGVLFWFGFCAMSAGDISTRGPLRPGTSLEPRKIPAEGPEARTVSEGWRVRLHE